MAPTFSLSEGVADNWPEKLERIYCASGPHLQKAGILYFTVKRAEAVKEILHIPILWTKFVSLTNNSVCSYHQKTNSWSSVSALHRLIWLLWSYPGSVISECGGMELGLEARHTDDSCSLSSSWLNSLSTCTLLILGTWITCSFLARRQGRLMVYGINCDLAW